MCILLQYYKHMQFMYYITIVMRYMANVYTYTLDLGHRNFAVRYTPRQIGFMQNIY